MFDASRRSPSALDAHLPAAPSHADVPPAREVRPRVGVSACVLGAQVRFNGGHCRTDLITDTLGSVMDLVGVCPEFEAGLGAPRESLRLVGTKDSLRLIASKSGRDETGRIERFARERIPMLVAMGLHGFILKKFSPTCGMERVKVYHSNGIPSNDARGIFAEALMVACPDLPVEEEGRLQDPGLREHFVTRVFANARWDAFRASDPSPRDLIEFHTRHKLLLLAHDRVGYQDLGVLVASAGTADMTNLLDAYEHGFRQVLAVAPTSRKHADVLYHLLGHVEAISSEERRDLRGCIEEYRHGHVPLVVPERLLFHHVRRDSAWAAQQVYFEPFPYELHLRNQVPRNPR